MLTPRPENAELLFPSVVAEFYKTSGKHMHTSNASDAFRVLTIFKKNQGCRVLMTCTVRGNARVVATGQYEQDLKEAYWSLLRRMSEDVRADLVGTCVAEKLETEPKGWVIDEKNEGNDRD